MCIVIIDQSIKTLNQVSKNVMNNLVIRQYKLYFIQQRSASFKTTWIPCSEIWNPGISLDNPSEEKYVCCSLMTSYKQPQDVGGFSGLTKISRNYRVP